MLEAAVRGRKTLSQCSDAGTPSWSWTPEKNHAPSSHQSLDPRFVSTRLAFLVLWGCRKKPFLLHRWRAVLCRQRCCSSHCSWPGDFAARSWEVLCTVAFCNYPREAPSPEGMATWAKPAVFLSSALAAGPQHHQTDALSCMWPALGRLLHGCFLQTVLIWKTFSATGDSEETPTINNHNAEINTQLMDVQYID